MTILQLEALPHLVTGWVANPVRAGRPITATVLSLDAVLLHEHSRLPRDQGTATILSSNAVLLPQQVLVPSALIACAVLGLVHDAVSIGAARPVL